MFVIRYDLNKNENFVILLWFIPILQQMQMLTLLSSSVYLLQFKNDQGCKCLPFETRTKLNTQRVKIQRAATFN